MGIHPVFRRRVRNILETDLISGMFQMSPVFSTLTVAKPLVTEGTSGCQMKDMDLIFPLLPYGFL